VAISRLLAMMREKRRETIKNGRNGHTFCPSVRLLFWFETENKIQKLGARATTMAGLRDCFCGTTPDVTVSQNIIWHCTFKSLHESRMNHRWKLKRCKENCKKPQFQPQKQDPSGSSKEDIERSSSLLTIIQPILQTLYYTVYNQGTSRPSIHQYD
jgi:hypothetical protein